MIDHFLKWTDETAARADAAAAGQFLASRVWKDGTTLPAAWFANHVIANLKVWRASQDVTSIGSKGDTIITHTFLTGWYASISTKNPLAILLNAAAFQFAIDRTKANARQAGMIVASNLTNAVLADLRFSPVFAGADYPFGGLNP